MTIPIDRLYHYIENTAQDIFGARVLIYRFWPHGSKNIQDLTPLRTEGALWENMTLWPAIYCNDQEPLDYDYYKANSLRRNGRFIDILKSCSLFSPEHNINFNAKNNIYEKSLLLHSEQRSTNLKKYQDDNLICVYYWNHAIISLDWFRFAKHVRQTKQVKKTFLIYNRAWSGTREYRLKFLDFLLRLGLENHCQTSVNPIEPELGVHYETYKFDNPIWRPTNVLENYFPINTAPSHYSADFDITDYEATDIEVVLETLFDDDRLHLTEKSLRPIACGQPFILAGTHGSLEYLRGYGFRTFSDVWNEDYDQIEDPEKRLVAIADLMKQIASWTPEVREHKMTLARAIAECNRQYFFSPEFFESVVSELKHNLSVAFQTLLQGNNFKPWLDLWDRRCQEPTVLEFLKTNNDMPHQATEIKYSVIRTLVEEYYRRSLHR